MFEYLANISRERAAKFGGASLLMAAVVAAYANHFHNGFHFDDAHTIENNAAICSLKNIGHFFSDASTFSALPSNQSYRPLVSTLIAIDYWFGGGLNPFVFHLSIFALFIALTLSLAFVIFRLVENGANSEANSWLALGAAAVYALHPANADTINYIIAVSDVISTLGIVSSFALYLAFPKWRRYYFYVLPAAIAILAKPPAAVFPVLFAIFRILFAGKAPEDQSRRRPVISWLGEVVPAFIICGAMVWLVQYMTPRTWVAGAASTRNYLITQPYVAWLYFKTFFWPSDLSADYDLSPLATTDDGRFWIGFLFVFLFLAGAIVTSCYKRTRVMGFGLVWFLFGLLPTSLLPLAEVMNDHRTFLPYVGLVIALAGAASLMIRKARYPLAIRIVAGATALFLLFVSGLTTWHRNEVWKTEESLWRDVTIKSPGNARGLMNYGVTLMGKGDYTGALDYFHRAQAITPYYSVLLINLAIAEDATNSPDAERHFREALQLASSTPDSYTYYARWLLARGRTAEARSLLEKASQFSRTDLTLQGLLAQAKNQILPTGQTPESYLTLSLQYYNDGFYAESIDASQAALALRPGYAEAWNNIGAAENRLGQYDKGAAACEQALRLKPGFELAQNNLQFARAMLKRQKAE